MSNIEKAAYVQLADIAVQIASIDSEGQYYVNIKNSFFGALGIGNDDYIAIQTAINYAQIHKMKVYCPSGVYGLSQTLIITNAIEIYGDGRYTVFIPLNDIPTSTSTNGSVINSDFGALLRVEKNASKNDGYYGVESPLDGVSVHDIFFKGNMRAYKCDALQLCYIDHCKFYNLMIEEIKGSAIKEYCIRENFFDKINIRYCGLKHNNGEDEKTKGHPALSVIPNPNGVDTTNLNLYSNIEIMCSFYTAIREYPDSNKYLNVNLHQMFYGYLGEMVALFSDGDLPKNDNGNYMDFDVIQVINTATYFKTIEFINCGAVWGGQTRSMIYNNKGSVNVIGGAYGGHWGSVATNYQGYDHQGIGFDVVDGMIHFSGVNMTDNYQIVKKTGMCYVTSDGGFTYDSGNMATTYANTPDPKQWVINQYLSHALYPYSSNLDSLRMFGGKFVIDRFVCETAMTVNYGNTLYKAGRRTDETGHGIFEVSNTLKLGDNAVNINTPWVGMLWKDTLNNIRMETSTYGSVTAGEAKAFTKGTTAPLLPQEGWIWYDSINKQFKGWNGTSWVVLVDSSTTVKIEVVTQAVYDALPSTKTSNNVIYMING